MIVLTEIVNKMNDEYFNSPEAFQSLQSFIANDAGNSDV